MPDDIDLLDAPAGGGADGKAPTDTGGADKGGGKGGSEREPSADAAGKSQADASDDGKGASDDGDAAPKGRKARESKVAKKAGDAKGEKGDPGKAKTGDVALFDDEGEDGGDSTGAPATWPDDWREKLSAGNEKLAKRLSRFASPEALMKSWQSLEQKLSSGEYKRSTLPDDASEEEKAEWRQANGVPDKPDGYQFPTIKGHEWSDDDKAVAGGFLARLHAANAPQSVVQEALGWYADLQQQSKQQRYEMDIADKENGDNELHIEWQRDYRGRNNLVKRALENEEFIDRELAQDFLHARTPDGRRLALKPSFRRFFADRGFELSGNAGMITGEQGARMGGRIDEIKKILATDRERYFSEGLDKELDELTKSMESGRSR